MKKNSLYVIVLIVGTISLLCACKKSKQNPFSDNGLPPATQTGKNIFACRLNGIPWIAGKTHSNLNAGFRGDTLFAFGITGNDTYFELLAIEIKGNVEKGKIYQTIDQSCSFRISTNRSCFGYGGVFSAFATNGTVQLTQTGGDRKIISGTFNCDIPVQGCDTLRYVDGRFDIQY